MTTIYLDAAHVPAQLRGAYRGSKFAVEVCERVHIPADAGLWSGGSRATYTALRVSDGASIPFPGQSAAPWDASRTGREVALVPGMAVVRASMFRGKDMGLKFYLHPSDAAPLLPVSDGDLSPVEQLVVDYTSGRKSSYAGQNRYQMAASDIRDALSWATYKDARGFSAPPTLEQWETAKAAMVARGYLTKAGAITPAGRNRAGRI